MKRIIYRAGICVALFAIVCGLWWMNSTESVLLGSQPAQTPASPSPLGKKVYEDRCAMCHGNDGKGGGLAASFLNPRPRDFTAGKYKFRSTESGSIPTDADLERTIREGLHATAMPDWKEFISGDSLTSVTAYVKSFSPRFQNEEPKPVKLGVPVPASQASIESGKNVFEKLQCYSCHGTDGAGKDAVASDLLDDWGNEIAPTNLTEPWTFRGGATATDIYLRFRTGIDGTPMPSYIGSASDKEMWDLANYVVTIGRKPVWEMDAAEVHTHYAALDEQHKSNPVGRGKYLVEVFGCGDCHSPYNADGTLTESMRFAGGLKWVAGPYGTFTTVNLTSDKETGLGNWSDEEIKRCITRGVRKDGSRALPFPMPWTTFANLKDDDLNAVIAYLRTIPPIYNKIPPPEPLNVFSYLWGKFKMLILKEDFPVYALYGNAGTTKEKAVSANPAQSSGKEAGQ